MKMWTMSVLVLGFCMLGITLSESQPPPSVASSALQRVNDQEGFRPDSATVLPTEVSQSCRPGEGWRWISGDFLPDIAFQAQQALQKEGIVSEVKARGFGEIDSCGYYRPSAVDFVVMLRPGQSFDGFTNTDRLGQVVQQILTPIARPSVGVVQIMFPDGEQLLLRSDVKVNAFPIGDPVRDPSLDTLTKKVYVVVYDPILDNGQHLSDYLHWLEHADLTQGTIDFFSQASHGKVDYQVVQTTILTDGWPEKIDGFRYTEREYLAAIRGQVPWHSPDGVNYNKIVNDSRLDICGKANRGEIDEVWIYNGPGFGFYESTLVGPGAYWYNSPPVPGPHSCNRLIPIMGPSPERGLDCAIENFGHRTESTMTQVYGSWQQNRTAHSWEKYALVKALSPNYNYSGCGNVHYPPNGVSDYDYGNSSTVNTNCDDFVNYPILSEPSTVWHPVTCSSWSCDHLQYFGYWFGHLPHNGGCGPDRVANDWWQYFANPGWASTPSVPCFSAGLKLYLPAVLRAYSGASAFCDHFDGAQLDPRWSLVDPLGGAQTQVNSGRLVFSTPGGGRDLYGSNTNAPRLLQSAPSGSWTVVTHVSVGSFGGGFQTAGLLYWLDAWHYLWVGIGSGNTVHGIVQSDAGRTGIPWLVTPKLDRTDLFVRLERTAAGSIKTSYSENGVVWFDSDDVQLPQSAAQVGPVLINAWAAPAFSGIFDYVLWNWCR